jgi:anaerobic magnesium-protoporphyrin IX monomethyl ester cyclase
MRLVLLYPPPWKIPAAGESPDLKDGPPLNYGNILIDDGDFLTSPYGLLSLAAQAMRAGHDALTLNLSDFPWRDIELLISHIKGDLFGLSCHVSNRRGVALLTKLIRKVHPKAHIVCGGPFITALPGETLKHYRAIDTVVIGEGEETFLELIRRLERGESTEGLAGTAWRRGDRIHFGPPRKRIADLDTLASPLDYFLTRILITSRGCPGECTFCGSKVMWGKKLTFHSVDYVLDMLQKAVNDYGQKIIAFKDDTFTAHRQRALAICRGIIRLKLNFVWSCDTRVNTLDEEVLHFMRLAGCQRLSLGVESASPLILKNIKKHISPELVLEVTQLAKKYGFQIRYYMIAGNRGETVETFQQSLDFLKNAQPHETVMNSLQIFPGTAEFDILKADGVMPEIFFTEDFDSLSKFPGRPLDNTQLRELYKEYLNRLDISYYPVEELKTILGRLPNHPGVHMDLAGAYCREGDYDNAEKHLNLALELNYPLEGHALNYLACIAAAKRDYPAVMANLIKAYRFFPHEVVMQNMKLLSTWHKEGGPQSHRNLNLICDNFFEQSIIFEQPEGPGPIQLHAIKTGKIYNLCQDGASEYYNRKPLDIRY